MAKRFKKANHHSSGTADDDDAPQQQQQRQHADGDHDDRNNKGSVDRDDYHHTKSALVRHAPPLTLLTTPTRLNEPPPQQHQQPYHQSPVFSTMMKLTSPAAPSSSQSLSPLVTLTPSSSSTANLRHNNNNNNDDHHQHAHILTRDESSDHASVTPLSSPFAAAATSSSSSSPMSSPSRHDHHSHTRDHDSDAAAVYDAPPSSASSSRGVKMYRTTTTAATVLTSLSSASSSSQSTMTPPMSSSARHIVLHNPDLLHCILVYVHSVALSFPINCVSRLCHAQVQQPRLWRTVDLSSAARTITVTTIHQLMTRYATVMVHLILDGCTLDATTLPLLRTLQPSHLARLSIRDTSLTSTHSDLKSILELVRSVPSLKWCYSGQSYSVGVTMALRARPGGYGGTAATATGAGDDNNAVDPLYAELAMELAARGGHCDYATSAICVRCRMTTIVQGCNACGRAVCLPCQHSVTGQSPIRSPLHGFDDDEPIARRRSHSHSTTSSTTSMSNDGLLMTICGGCDRCYCVDCRRFTSCTGGCHSGQRCDDCTRQHPCTACGDLVCTARCILRCHGSCERAWCRQCARHTLIVDERAGTICLPCDNHQPMATSSSSSASAAALSH